MVSKAGEFRKLAEAAKETASRSTTEEEKAFWLRAFQDWSRLAEEADKIEIERGRR
jgi:hypothetical protein